MAFRVEENYRISCLFGGVADVNCITLLPGETWEVEITGADLAAVDFGGRPIVQCANWYGKR